MLDLAAELKAAPYDAQAARRPAHRRDDLRQADPAHPGRRSPPASPSSAATRCWSTAASPASASASRCDDVARVLGRQASVIVWRTYAPERPRGDGRARRRARSSTRSPTTSTPASCSPTCSTDPRAQAASSPGSRVAFVGDGACNMGNSWLLAGATAGHARAGRRARGLRARRARWSSARATIAADHRRLGRRSSPTRSRPSPAPTSSSPTPGSRWARRTRPRRALRSSRRTRVTDASSSRTPSPTRSCCTACRPTAARRSPPRCIDGPQSVVWDEAENRRHAQKAILTWLARRRLMMSTALRPTTKNARHQRIVELVTHHEVRSQTELADLLAEQRRARHPGHAVARPRRARRGQGAQRRPARSSTPYPAEGGDRRPAAPGETAAGRDPAGPAVRRAARQRRGQRQPRRAAHPARCRPVPRLAPSTRPSSPDDPRHHRRRRHRPRDRPRPERRRRPRPPVPRPAPTTRTTTPPAKKDIP